MPTESEGLKADVLIIGSLYWDNHKRSTWRNSRLRMDEARLVDARIRYGRKSGGARGWTMIFSQSADPGSAYVVPCARRVHGLADLQEEICYLAYAEGLSKKPDQGVWSRWGAVGARAREAHSPAGEIVRDWGASFRKQSPENIERFKGASGEAPINETGELQIEWPTYCGTEDLVDCDILLGSVNKPTLDDEGRYPSPKEIAEDYCAAGDINYFFNNVLNSIRTDQDGQIWQCIAERLRL